VLRHPASAFLIVFSPRIVIAVAVVVALEVSRRWLLDDSLGYVRLSMRLLCDREAHPRRNCSWFSLAMRNLTERETEVQGSGGAVKWTSEIALQTEDDKEDQITIRSI
jgi:hypothetical protein